MTESPVTAETARERGTGFFYRPQNLLFITVATICITEFLIMLALLKLPALTPLERAVTDAVVLSLTMVPSLHFFLVKPMRLHMRDKLQAEADKDLLILELQKALDEVKTLRGIVPICAWCKNVRDDNGYWQDVESYMEARTDAAFSHGICPECAARIEL